MSLGAPCRTESPLSVPSAMGIPSHVFQMAALDYITATIHQNPEQAYPGLYSMACFGRAASFQTIGILSPQKCRERILGTARGVDDETDGNVSWPVFAERSPSGRG